jgi:ATP phosphoribosyltransferase
MSVKLGIPSKGRLMQDTFDWFAERGVSIERTGTEREYAGRIDGVDGIDLVLLAAGEIPRELASGRIALGVTGSDVVQEKIARWADKIEPLAGLGFGQADLVLAVPKTWADVRDLDDLDAVAEAFRQTHGFRLRIATKYHRLVRAHLKAAGVAGYQLIDSQGATEGTVANLTAEAIADITSSGATLDANHLKVIGGVMHASQATLFRSKSARLDADDAARLAVLLKRIGV